MNKYNNNNNNFSRLPAGDSPMRFNKRTRYVGNSVGGGSSASRFKHPHQTGYQYSQNRNNTADNYQSNQYENGSRNFYGSLLKRPNNNNQRQNNKQSSPYTHKSTVSSCLNPSSSSYSAPTQNILSLPPTQPKGITPQTASATVTAQNSQQSQQQSTTPTLDSSNYYGYGYNSFYSTTYNADLIGAASTSTFGVADGLSPFMWETIKSTPPPKLPTQQQQLQTPLSQPPPMLPPLPSSDTLPHLPPPPIPPQIPPASNMLSSSSGKTAAKTIVKMKAKRKAMSMRYKISKSWSEESALLALKAEETNVKKLNDIVLILRFPDPEISREIVKCYNPNIESVHFQLNFAPRYCLIHLKPGTDVDKTIDDLTKIQFGTGFLSVEIKQIPYKAHSTKLSEIDPFTLYVGNLPTTIACKTLKEHFPGAARIDIGFAQRMKYTRYAFIRYQSVQQAIEAYKRMLDAEIGGRTLTIRFRRLTAASDGSKEDEAENLDDEAENPDHDDLFSQTAITSGDNLTHILQTDCEGMDPVASLEETTSTDLTENNLNVQHNTDSATNEVNEKTGSMNQSHTSESNQAQTSNKTSLMATENETTRSNSTTHLLHIKHDPDMDPNDKVVRNDNITSHVETSNEIIKQEEDDLALHTEIFAKPNNKTNSGREIIEKSTSNDKVSLHSETDETDTISSLSTISLGEFLKSCQSLQSPSNKNKAVDSYPASDNVEATIKSEALENDITNRKDLSISSKHLDLVKQEPQGDVAIQNTLNAESNNLSNTVSRSREGASPNPNNIIDNDDIVPSTAFFSRSDYQSALPILSNSICEYDEFYETRINVSSQINIKNEPLDIPRRKTINKNGKRFHQPEIINPKRNINNSLLSKQQCNINFTKTSGASNGDDLVPSQNFLGSCRPSWNAIKQELEHEDIFSVPSKKTNQLNKQEDIFSVPLNKTNHLNEDDICSNDSTENLLPQSKNTEKNAEVLNSYVPEEDDDDVIIISDNIIHQPIETKSYNETNLFFHKQVDLVSLNQFPITNPVRQVTKLWYRDNLDELYEQLDADSDSDL